MGWGYGVERKRIGLFGSVAVMYSVKSTYYSAMNELIDTIDSRVDGNRFQIWKLKVPPKVKLHL